MDYDTPDEGNDFVISYGDDPMVSTRHIIDGPVALWQAQDGNGLVI